MRSPSCSSWLLLIAACGSPPPTVAQTGAMNQVASRAADAVAAMPPPAATWRRLVDAWVHPNPIPSFPLVDQEGRAFRLGELRDSHVLVGLIFTHCSVPKACPLTTQKMHEVGKLWSRAQREGRAGDEDLRLLTLTFDPEADTPEVLKAYSEVVRRDLPDWIFATGPTELMEARLPKMFGVIAGDKDADGQIAHSVKVALLGPGLRPEQIWTDNAFEPEAIIEQVLR